MDRYPFDDQATEGGDLPETSATESLDFTEEFDISSFDFTIADPGEIREFSEERESAEESAESAEPPSEMEELFGTDEKESKFSFRKKPEAKEIMDMEDKENDGDTTFYPPATEKKKKKK